MHCTARDSSVQISIVRMLQNPAFTNEMKTFDFAKSCTALGHALEHTGMTSVTIFPTMKFMRQHTLLPMWPRPSQPGLASIHVSGPLFSILMWTNRPIIVSSWHRWTPTGFWKGSARAEGSQEGSFWSRAFAFNIFQDRGLSCPCSLAETNVRWFKMNSGK